MMTALEACHRARDAWERAGRPGDVPQLQLFRTLDGAGSNYVEQEGPDSFIPAHAGSQGGAAPVPSSARPCREGSSLVPPGLPGTARSTNQ